MAPSGYSGRSLADKLGIKTGSVIHAIAAPDNYEELIGEIVGAVVRRAAPQDGAGFIHVFVRSRDELVEASSLVARLNPEGTLWVSWPKKSSGFKTDLTEDTLREVLLPLEVVDVKVCAVDDTWSGLKFLWRRTSAS